MKKILAAVLSLVLVFSLCVNVSLAAEPAGGDAAATEISAAAFAEKPSGAPAATDVPATGDASGATEAAGENEGEPGRSGPDVGLIIAITAGVLLAAAIVAAVVSAVKKKK